METESLYFSASDASKLKKAMEHYQTDIEAHISQGRQYANVDFEAQLIKILIFSLNTNRPGVNAEYIEGFDRLFSKIEQAGPVNQHRRIILKGQGLHFGAMNVFTDENNRKSVIYLDSVGENSGVAAMNMFRIASRYRQDDHIKVMLVPMGIQTSMEDCMIYSLHFVSRMFKHRDRFESLHAKLFKDDVLNKFLNENFYSLKNTTRSTQYIPAQFFKHIGSRTLLRELIGPDGFDKPAHDALIARQQTKVVTGEMMGKNGYKEGKYVNSIGFKRKKIVDIACELVRNLPQ
ncbi:hypothetical protein GE278_10105 [Enterobacteriaceae bacterium Kacie_13]|nr:hypothetical protein GE278_10105 [Enterobacteriaceae bacterium Kacie_13]